MRGYVERKIHESRGPNRDPVIDYINRSQGNRVGDPYCAAAVGHCLDSAGAVLPRYRSGLAIRYRESPWISARDVITGRVKLPVGALSIWQHGDTYKGHIGIVEVVKSSTVIVCLEANTSGTSSGSIRDGGGFYRKTREIQPYNHFGIKYFKIVTYT